MISSSAGARCAGAVPCSVEGVFWRAEHALLNGGDFATVLTYHGGMTINLIEQLHLTPDHTDVDEGWMTLIEQGDDLAEIIVPAHEYFRDKSTTLKGNRRKQTQHCRRCSCDAA